MRGDWKHQAEFHQSLQKRLSGGNSKTRSRRLAFSAIVFLLALLIVMGLRSPTYPGGGFILSMIGLALLFVALLVFMFGRR